MLFAIAFYFASVLWSARLKYSMLFICELVLSSICHVSAMYLLRVNGVNLLNIMCILHFLRVDTNNDVFCVSMLLY